MPGLDAYGDWLKIPWERRGPDGRPLTYYDLLRLAPDEATHDRVVKAAIEQTASVRVYDNSPQEGARQWVDRLRGEIAEALRCLIDPQKKREYDRARLGQAGVVPPEDDTSVLHGPPVPIDSSVVTADRSEADQQVLDWLMQAGESDEPQKAERRRALTGSEQAAAKRLAAVRVVHRNEWIEEVSRRREKSRVQRRVTSGLAAAACVLMGIAVLGWLVGSAPQPPPECPADLTAQLESGPIPDPATPADAASPEASPGPSPGSSTGSTMASGDAGVSGASPRTEPRDRSIMLTLPGAVHEGAVVTLKAELGEKVAPARCAVRIDWGDGTAPEEAKATPSPAPPGGQTIEGKHVYADDGEFLVRVATLVDYTLKTIATQKVKVENVAPKLNIKRCEALRERVVRVEAGFTDPGAKDTHDVLIQWGDGTDASVEPRSPFVQGEWMIAAIHTYPDTDDYTIAITVVDKDDGSEQVRRTVSASAGRSSSGVSQGPSSARADPTGGEKWFAVIAYEKDSWEMMMPGMGNAKTSSVISKAVVCGESRAHAKVTEFRRRYVASKSVTVEMIQCSSREEAQRATAEPR